MSGTTRLDAYTIVDSERDYQDWKHGLDKHSPQEWLSYIQVYVNEALALAAHNTGAYCEKAQMEIIRKIAGMAIAAIEEHGAPIRSKV